MAATKKIINVKNFYDSGVISETVKDRSDDPFFVKKAEEAKAFLRKHPVPEHLLKK